MMLAMRARAPIVAALSAPSSAIAAVKIEAATP
jgi:hypothetical protein